MKGLKAKNNELIREHVEMVKDKNSLGIQLQNQRLDIKRLTSLQSIHAARAAAEKSYAPKTQLDEKTRPSFLTYKSTALENSEKTAADRRMSSFFAIDQISDELAQVAVRSLNIENIEPSRIPQICDALVNKNGSVYEKFEDAGGNAGKLQSFSDSCEVPKGEAACFMGMTKLQPPKTPKSGALTGKLLPKQIDAQSSDDGAQGKPSRQRTQVNYKEASLFIKSVNMCESR